MARTGPHQVVVELAAQAGVPVINGLTLREQPCQALADLFTLHERFGDLRGVVLAFVGDGNNVYHSLALMGATLGMEIRLAHPDGYGPNDRIVTRARELAAASDGRLVFAANPPRWCRRRSHLHRRLDVWARRPRRRSGARVPRYRSRAMLARPARGSRDALPARASRRGDHVRRDGWAAERELRPVRETASCPEGPPSGTPPITPRH